MKTYTYNGYTITEFTADKLRLLWWDKPKNGIPKNAFNLGFFGNFDIKDEKGKAKLEYTLPVGNICVDAEDIGTQQIADIRSWHGTVDDKVRLNVNQNGSPQFKNKFVTTLLIDRNNKVSFAECDSFSEAYKYAVSGSPIIRNGADVSYTNVFRPQGWYDDILRATSRNCLGNKVGINGVDSVMYLISGSTKTTNYLKTSEIYNALKALKLDNLIGLDGGGSYISNVGGKTLTTGGTRRINTIGVISE